MNTARTAIWARRLVASGIVVGSLFAASGTAGAASLLPADQGVAEAPRETATDTTVDPRLTAEVEGTRILVALLLPAVLGAVEAPRETTTDTTVDPRLTAEVEPSRSILVPDFDLTLCVERPQDDLDPEDPCR